MADIVKLSSIISKVREIIETEFGCPIYSDEVKENFSKPCFFIALTVVNKPQTINFSQKDVDIIITYFPPDNKRNEVHYMDVFDRIQTVFGIGMQVKDRFLHIEDITEDRAGEDQDILQVTITITYLDKLEKEIGTTELMGELQTKVYTNEGKEDEELWQN